MKKTEKVKEQEIQNPESGLLHDGINFATLTDQIKRERDFSRKSLDPKKDTWRNRLKLYNNQKKEAEANGDPLMFTVFQTVLASLYEDELSVGFNGTSEGDYEVAKNIEQMAESDRPRMELDELEYDYAWNACFFGRSYMLMQRFDRKAQIPVPEVIDPLTIERDPFANSVNGKGRDRKGASRFFGIERFVVPSELTEEQGFFNVDKLTKTPEEDFTGADKDRQARADASGRSFERSQTELGCNTEYPVYQWFTHWKVMEEEEIEDPKTGQINTVQYENVRKVEVWLTADLKTVIKFEILKDYNGKHCTDWPIIDRPLYPTAQDWDGVSIPDLTEDKQRTRAAIINLTVQGLKADLFPMYIYDKRKITNRNDLNFAFNKMVPSDGEVTNAITPMNKANPRMDMVSFVLDTLDQSAQRATATPEVQQGMVSGQARTLGELNLVAAKVDTRFTLSMKIWGWSAKRFWKRWWEQYMENMADDIDEKVIAISGVLGTSSRTFKKADLSLKGDPDITIESKIISESKRAMKLQSFTDISSIYAESGIINLTYQARKHFELAGLGKDEIEMLLPPSVDELVAEGENRELSQDKTTSIAEMDNHQVHIMVHARAKQTKALVAHIQAHQKALTIPRDKQIAGEDPGLTPTSGAPGMLPQPGANPSAPVGSVPMAPTASEMASGGGAGSTPGGAAAVIPGM